ncbi:MAG: BCCT family transporter [Bradymonadia bacterium]
MSQLCVFGIHTVLPFARCQNNSAIEYEQERRTVRLGTEALTLLKHRRDVRPKDNDCYSNYCLSTETYGGSPISSSNKPTGQGITLDKPVFWSSLIVLISITSVLLSFPEQSLKIMQKVHGFLTLDMGWLFLGFVFLAIVGLGWVAFSRHGEIILGQPGQPPAYGTVSWFGMLFCAGIGSNLLYFGTTEWTAYFLKPPPLSGATPESLLAADWAGAYSFFHWGISAWAVYALATVPIAYVLHVKRADTLRISTSCESSLPSRMRAGLSPVIDCLFIFGLVGGVGTSLGVGIPMLSAVASDLFGFERGMALDTGILIGLTAMFSYSVSAGLDKGIKLLSDINVALAILLLAFVLLVGPTSFILNQAFDSLSVMFQNFIEMSLRMDAGSESSFAAGNTVFFWAWWLAWAPFMGLFIARISAGRSIRQVIIGCALGGAAACWTGFSILGHTTMALARTSGTKVQELMVAAKANGGAVDAPQMVVELLNSLPMPGLISGIFFVLSFIFVATSLDSAAFTLASTASLNLPNDAQPPRWHRLVWAFVLAGTSLSLMYLGGLKILQTASILVGFPLMLVMGLMAKSFLTNLQNHEHK